LVSTETVAEMA